LASLTRLQIVNDEVWSSTSLEVEMYDELFSGFTNLNGLINHGKFLTHRL
jgi:hypothetical protein